MTTASRSLATALWKARTASGLLPPSYTTNRDTTQPSVWARSCWPIAPVDHGRPTASKPLGRRLAKQPTSPASHFMTSAELPYRGLRYAVQPNSKSRPWPAKASETCAASWTRITSIAIQNSRDLRFESSKREQKRPT